MPACYLQSPPHRQQGSALVIGMIFLLILTIGSVSMMNSSVLDERMTGNSKATAAAFMAAEAGQIAAFDYISDNWNTFSCTVGDTLPGMNNTTHSAANSSTYTVSVETCSSKTVGIRSDGAAGNALRTVVFDIESTGGGIVPPAAISCFGGSCEIIAGTGNSAPISGRDHPIPDADCSGNSCWMDPYSDGLSIPAVFLNDYSGSTISVGKGKGNSKKLAFEGQNRDYASYDDSQTYWTSGSDKNSKAVWGPEHYPDDAEGNSTAPTTENYFGSDSSLSTILAAADIADSTLGSVDSPKVSRLDTSSDSGLDIGKSAAGVLVIDGDTPGTIKHTGTGFYAGLVIIKGCNQLNTGGNFTIYGAIIVDATGCEQPYTPFVGNGTPDVKYSLEALEKSNSLTGGLVINDWYEKG